VSLRGTEFTCGAVTGPSGVFPGRVIIDPNVFVSVLMARRDSAVVAIAQAVAADKLFLVVCPHLLAELTGVARREKFRKYSPLSRLSCWLPHWS
jgi:predicted nucleic acid-binding protein